MKIRNAERLVAHGAVASRRVVLDIAEKTLQRLDAYHRIKSITRFEGSSLHIGTRTWDLSRKRHVYLVGAGKACNAMASALDEILGDRLTRGIAIVKIAEEEDSFRNTEVFVGGHPLPDEAGHAAALEILGLADGARPDDLFIAAISGGSSALMSCPVEGISLQDEIDATDVLLKCGAGIYEINAIRRHISQTNGGMLAKRIQASGAELIGFGISDAVGNPPTLDIGVPCREYASTPIGPDRTTFADARRVINDYDLTERLPASVVRRIMEADEEQETPKAFPDNTYYLINTVADLPRFAREAAREMGVTAHILTSFLEGESRDAGTVLASIAREVQAYGNPFPAPCVILSSGETTTKIPKDGVKGHGGPSLELTASFALSAGKIPGACLLSVDSEGTDGTTRAAGGLTDSTSHETAVEQGINLRAALRGHSCFEALHSIGDTVFTGNTGTNLCDFNVLYVPAVQD